MLQRSDDLICNLEVFNDGNTPFPCQALLHPYLLVENDDIAEARVRGLSGRRYMSEKEADRCDGRVDTREAVAITGELDRCYYEVPRQVELATPSSVISVLRLGEPSEADCTLWNPWAAKTKKMADCEDDDYRRFVCIEHCVGRAPVTVEPQTSWVFAEKFSARDM